LAKELWSTKNHDARILSTMIMNPIDLERTQLKEWVNDLDNYVITDAFVKMAFQSEQAYPLMLEWISSDKEFISAAGWNMVALYAMEMNDEDDRFFLDFLETIGKTIHSSPNRTRYNMNNALIAIGARNEILKDAAIKVAEVVGKVEVDHGQTSCKTPDARSYIVRAFEHKKKRKK
jgi:3-methyladenine DNA glycosylase AlkD